MGNGNLHPCKTDASLQVIDLVIEIHLSNCAISFQNDFISLCLSAGPEPKEHAQN